MTLHTGVWMEMGYHNIPAFSSKSVGISIGIIMYTYFE